MNKNFVTRSYLTRFTFSLFDLGVKLGLTMVRKTFTDVHVWANEKLSKQGLEKIK